MSRIRTLLTNLFFVALLLLYFRDVQPFLLERMARVYETRHLACFFPSRAFFTLEEWLTHQSLFQRLISFAALALVLWLALASLPTASS